MRQEIRATGGVRSQSVSISDGYVILNGERYTVPSQASVAVKNGVIFVDGKRWEGPSDAATDQWEIDG